MNANFTWKSLNMRNYIPCSVVWMQLFLRCYFIVTCEQVLLIKTGSFSCFLSRESAALVIYIHGLQVQTKIQFFIWRCSSCWKKGSLPDCNCRTLFVAFLWLPLMTSSVHNRLLKRIWKNTEILSGQMK